jgi:hypothetical protein
MLLGLGAGMGFIYWNMKMQTERYVFIGGRGNTKAFFQDLGTRTGVDIRSISTSSARKAQASLLTKLGHHEPVMLFADMGFLPWFDLPEDYHFGGHTFVICGYDGQDPITLDQLANARGSTHKPFPPKHTALDFDFTRFHQPRAADVVAAIKQTVDAQLHPPIKNFGVKGLRHTSRELMKWPNMFDDHALRMNLFSLYIFIEIGGTGGGCFRYMYSRFLKEAQTLTGITALADASQIVQDSGTKFTQIGLLFKDAETMTNLPNAMDLASHMFADLATLEECAYTLLEDTID